MTKKEKVKKILEELHKKFGEPKCALNFETPFELLVAVILSAQCTDKRVNIVTEEMFKEVNTPEQFANMEIEEIENYIKSTGFFRNKAKNIKKCSQQLLEKYNGEIPQDMDKLTELAGVGRKTANVIRGNIFDMPSIVVDTHVKRITKKLGLTESDDPVKIEFELMEILPKDHWILWNTDLITLGRTICIARSEKCDICFLREDCPSAKV